MKKGHNALLSILLVLCLLCAAGPALLPAQSAAVEMQNLLAAEAVTYAQASRFVLEASEAAMFDDPMQAFHFARERNWLPSGASPHDPARLDRVSLLLMRSFYLRGGALFTLTGSPRFAYREMEHRGIIHGRASPRQSVSGETLLYMTGRILSGVEERLGLTAEIERQRLLAEAERQRERERLAEELLAAAEREALAALIYLQLGDLELHDLELAVTGEGVMITLADIQFLADSAEVTGDGRRQIYEIAAILRGIPGRIAVAGHAALAGTVESRLAISTDRAQAVADLLASFGARHIGEISVTGYGADRPVADNDTPQGMAANRRVEIIILEH